MESDSYTIKELMINVGDNHKLYVQMWGNEAAQETFIFLHGGPGGSSSAGQKQYFNPLTQRVIFFDQRGCGKSTPYGSLEHNTTDEQVEDIETIIRKLNIETFSLVGGSWGSCLALVYGIKYPEKVKRMILRGIFTGRKEEIEYLDSGMCKLLFPEIWQAYIHDVPKAYKNKPTDYHFSNILGNDETSSIKSAYAYSMLEYSLISADDRRSLQPIDVFDPLPIRMECYYLANKCFLPEGYIFKNSKRLTMPIALVQGRYDMVCPPVTAYEIDKVLPNSKLYWTIGGHSGNDRSNWDVIHTLIQS